MEIKKGQRTTDSGQWTKNRLRFFWSVVRCPLSTVLYPLSIVLFCFLSPAEAHEWKEIDRGLFYTQTAQIHVFKIDPEKFRLSVATAGDLRQQSTTVKTLAKKTKAVLAINGGFFSPENKSLGLLMRDGKTINPLHPTPWWGVFYIMDQKPMIVPPYAFRKNSKMEIALQVGPRLVVNGKISKFKPSLARRSGVGIQPEGTVIIAASEKELPMESFAAFLKGLGCMDALNLDGGGSTQLYIDRNGFKLNIEGPSPITNAITVLPRY